MLMKRLFAPSALLCALVFLTAPVSASIQYKIDRETLADLSEPREAGAKLKIARIPIDGEMESLELERFEVFAKDADIKTLGANDEVLEVLDLPKTQYYRGRIAGQADSFAFLSVTGPRVEGLIFKGDRRFGIGTRVRTHKQATHEGEGVDIFVQESEPIDDIPADGKGFVCELDSSSISRHPSLSAVVRNLPTPRTEGTLSTGTARWVINMAIETDYELFLNTDSSSSDVTTFIGNLVGAMSTIYNRELTAEVVVSSLTINTSVADPFVVVPGAAGTWNGNPKNCVSPFDTPEKQCLSSFHAVLEFGDRWHNTPPSANPRSVTALISGKPQQAGIAWLNQLCSGDFLCAGGNCGSSDANGHYAGRYSFNGGINPPSDESVPNPDANAPTYTAPASNYWPLLQVSHETGHNVFSGHTHCKVLSAPDQVVYGRTYVDNCHNLDGGCYNGAVSVPPEKGTIMSYCHIRSPLFSQNTRFIFGKVGEASYVMPDELKLAIQNATPNLSAITAPAALASGQSGNASVTNVGGLTYLWTITNGVINSGQGTSSINFTANTNPTNVKVLATNTAGCSITDSKDVTVTSATYNPPTNVVATATTATNVQISWSVPSGTTPIEYRVYRSSNGSTYSFVNSVTHPTTVFNDATAVANTAYLYKVRSSAAAGVSESSDSNRDLATTVIFTNDPLVVSTTQIQTTHINQLRTAINAVRTLASLSAGSYTDPSLTVGVTTIKRLHVIDLRTAIDAARSALTLSALVYGETITASVTSVKASHLTELRNGVK
jgi:hypothetical protein